MVKQTTQNSRNQTSQVVTTTDKTTHILTTVWILLWPVLLKLFQ